MYTKKKSFKLLVINLFFACFLTIKLSYSQDIPPYASNQPITTPRFFLIANSQHPFDLTFTEDGKTAYLMGDSGLVMCNYTNGNWSTPVIPEFTRSFTGIETPEISPDGKKFFFLGVGDSNQPDGFYVMNKIESGWSEPLNIGINTDGFETDPSTSINGNLYFLSSSTGKGSLYFSRFINNNYTEPQKLDDIINKYNVFTPYIAPDESYILFSVLRTSGNNTFANLYISFKRDNNEWTEPKDLGTKINAGYFQQRPSISPDGKYLFFTRSNATSTSIYQVDWKPILDSLKNLILPTGILNNSVKPIPDKLTLNQNYPNPFNPETVITYQLPACCHVELKVCDVLGHEVSTLVNEEQNAGSYEVKFNGQNLASGIYLYRIQAGDFTKAQKMSLIR